jgi:hypothetical protein
MTFLRRLINNARRRRRLDGIEILIAAVHESESVQVFGRRDAKIIHALWRPASEKRQGRKSRGVGTDSAAGAMGIWRLRECWGS